MLRAELRAEHTSCLSVSKPTDVWFPHFTFIPCQVELLRSAISHCASAGEQCTKPLQTNPSAAPEPRWTPGSVTFRQACTFPQINSTLSHLFPPFLSPMTFSFFEKESKLSSRWKNKRGEGGAAASQPFPQLVFSPAVYFTPLPCKQLTVFEPGLSPALLCPAVIAASLGES